MKKKFKKWLPGRKESTGWKKSSLKQTDRHHKSPGGDLCIRDSPPERLPDGTLACWQAHERAGAGQLSAADSPV
ncbi:hypothetical protein C6X66_17565 [Escherichia coli]|nr:hypothetical protein [Escherichia coli]EFN7854820.1 hypothetical protein [Escherichia coli]EFO0769431.1 hypothetical protein [Escherichia coli]EFO3265136.1 hypothetical protein [Escherichia coli]MGH33324.1 hypothetical protein [Escherichia coli]